MITSLIFLGSLKNRGLPRWLGGKNPLANAGDEGSIPGSGRSPREGNGNPLQYSCLGNPMTEDPGRLQSMGSQRVGHDLATNNNPRKAGQGQSGLLITGHSTWPSV